ncbi:MAG: 3-methyl-2-oxobutanoate hydroxymethyltransferase [Alphaproteobacteria bacterium]
MEKRVSVTDIMACKGRQPVVTLTCYTASMARLIDPHVDILLVGDSLGMVVYGMESTLAVSLDMMIAHGKAVVNSSSKALVVVDMPFGSYQASREQAFVSAARILAETGAQAVKLEGGAEMADTIRYLVQRGIPVMGHVGLMPQHFNVLGGYRYQGRTDKEARLIMENAQAVEAAGAFCIVLEAVKEKIATDISRTLSIPTIGIGASAACDGQVLVTEDMLGITARVPGFVKQYASLAGQIEKAVKQYRTDVIRRRFPGADHVYGGKRN